MSVRISLLPIKGLLAAQRRTTDRAMARDAERWRRRSAAPNARPPQPAAGSDTQRILERAAELLDAPDRRGKGRGR